MKVKELIELLKDVDGERLVVMSGDGEGNSCSPLYDFSERAYQADTTWSGEVGLETLSEEDRRSGYTEEDVLKDGVPALVLWPTN